MVRSEASFPKPSIYVTGAYRTQSTSIIETKAADTTRSLAIPTLTASRYIGGKVRSFSLKEHC